MLRPRAASGFTLIELAVTITVFAILVLTGAQSFSTWIANAQVRSVAESIQNGLHLAQAEAGRRNRQTRLILTDSSPIAGTAWVASATGRNWVITTVPRLRNASGALETADFIGGGSLGNVASNVAIAGPATLTFTSLGIVTGAAGVSTYAVTRPGADHPISVKVSVGGQIRSCDAALSITTSPEGC